MLLEHIGDKPRMNPPPASRIEGLAEAWRAYYARANAEQPRHRGARDYLLSDLREALQRLVPGHASVLEVGCGEGALLASLPNAVRVGVDMFPETVERA